MECSTLSTKKFGKFFGFPAKTFLCHLSGPTVKKSHFTNYIFNVPFTFLKIRSAETISSKVELHFTSTLYFTEASLFS